MSGGGLSSLWSGPARSQAGRDETTVVRNALTSKQLQIYAALVRIGEIEQVLATAKYVQWAQNPRVVPGHALRDPAPTYDARGRRTNTPDVVLRQSLEAERNTLVRFALATLPLYKAPAGYNPNVTITEKLFLNAQDHPEVNFMGLLLGPRGNTLKKLQADSGARIGLRGRGSVKGGRAVVGNNLDEDLHCLITADSQEKVDLAKRLCLKVVDEVLHAPEGQNEHKRNQLKELAIINGTYRETVAVCQICGEEGHRRFQCPNGELASNFKCGKCGQVGHLEADCQQDAGAGEMDEEFDEFMKELGEDSNEAATPSVAASEPLNENYGHIDQQSNYKDSGSSIKRPHNDSHSESYEYAQQGYSDYKRRDYGHARDARDVRDNRDSRAYKDRRGYGSYGGQGYGQSFTNYGQNYSQDYHGQRYNQGYNQRYNQGYGQGHSQDYGNQNYRGQGHGYSAASTYSNSPANPAPAPVAPAYGFSASPFAKAAPRAPSAPPPAPKPNVPPPPPKAVPPPPPKLAAPPSRLPPPPPARSGLPPPPPPKT